MSFANRFKQGWRPAPLEAPTPSANEVVVWRVALETVSVKDATVLAVDERERAERLKIPAVRLAFIQGRLFLRRMLGRTLGRDPGSLQFASEGNGKPTLPAAPLAFNLSHSGGVAALAIAKVGPVGIDVEELRGDRDLVGLASRYFAPLEYAALLRLPSAQRTLGFYSCWTRKEAFIKALGEGLSHPLDAFEVSLDPSAPAAFLSIGGKQADDSPWRLFSIDFGERYAGALVAPRQVERLSCFTLETI
jgi:4'-phosphopantetheinyl transferase